MGQLRVLNATHKSECTGMGTHPLGGAGKKGERLSTGGGTRRQKIWHCLWLCGRCVCLVPVRALHITRRGVGRLSMSLQCQLLLPFPGGNLSLFVTKTSVVGRVDLLFCFSVALNVRARCFHAVLFLVVLFALSRSMLTVPS